MSSKKHVVRQGECLSSIAAHYGLLDWRFIYDSPENQGFKSKRPNPNLIYPGDEVVIPTRRDKSVPVGSATEQKFTVTRPKTKLMLRVFDGVGAPPTKADYQLFVDGVPEPFTGSLAGGLLETKIPARASRARLVIRSADTGATIDELELLLGGLDPVETVSGMQMRLRRIGYDCGPATGEMTPATEAALRLFQRRHQLTEDGACSAETQAKLKSLVGV
jgi:N-acetylmuramoyl-L-alanine amidase